MRRTLRCMSHSPCLARGWRHHRSAPMRRYISSVGLRAGALGKRDNTVTLLLGVCTTRAGQTSTSWATSLAWSLAASRSVVLVDCDMEGGTIADLLYLRLDDRGLANCFGDRAVTATVLAAQTIPVPDRPGLRVIPGLRSTYGLEIGDCLRSIAPALDALPVTPSSSISGIHGRTQASDPREPLQTRSAPSSIASSS